MSIEKNVYDFGAIGDGVADDTAALQLAFDSTRALYFPPGNYRITAPIIQTKAMRIFGDGMVSKIAIEGSNHLGAIIVRPDVQEKHFWTYTGLNITGPTPALYLDIAQSGVYIDRLLVADNWFQNTADGVSLKLNNPNNTDGLFLCEFSRNVFRGGLHLFRLGDSITIENNQITGMGTGIDFTAVPGASHVNIRENNITSRGRAINVGEAAHRTIIENNQIENMFGSNNYMIMVQGSTAFPVNYPIIRGNNMNGHGNIPQALVALVNCNNGLVDENIMNGSPNAIYITSNSAKNRIGKRNVNLCANYLVNQSSTTIIE